jgi:multidrug efflux pump subunit AcrA (membrane-fusion protein)
MKPHSGTGALTSAHLPTLRLVQTPHSARVLAVALVITLGCVVVGLVVTPWQQSVVGQGRVVAFSPVERHQKLEAPVDGRIARVLTLEGQRVGADEIVVEIVDVDPRFVERLEGERQLLRLRREAAEGRRAQIGERITALSVGRESALAAAAARVEMGRDRVRQAEQGVAAAEAARAAADLNLPRVTELAEKGLRSTRDRELAAADAARARADEARSHAAVVAAHNEVASLDADRKRLEQDTGAAINDARAAEQVAHADVASANAELLRMETRLSRQSTQAVTLPREAVVLRVLAQEGQLVKAGDPLLELVPVTTERAVEVWVDGNDAPLVTAGRHVRLQFEGWPALQFVGWPQAARGTFGGTVALVDAHDDGNGRFRVLVRPGDEAWPDGGVLRQGVRANAFILLEQVPLGYELWRRLNAFPPTLSEDPTKAKASKEKS